MLDEAFALAVPLIKLPLRLGRRQGRAHIGDQQLHRPLAPEFVDLQIEGGFPKSLDSIDERKILWYTGGCMKLCREVLLWHTKRHSPPGLFRQGTSHPLPPALEN